MISKTGDGIFEAEEISLFESGTTKTGEASLSELFLDCVSEFGVTGGGAVSFLSKIHPGESLSTGVAEEKSSKYTCRARLMVSDWESR